MSGLTGRIARPFERLGPRWLDALHANPRHLFIPARAWAHPDDGDGYPIDRDADPVAWERAVYSDIPIITQLDDGDTPITTGKGRYTSSCSMPSVVATQLGLLDLHRDDDVLEIGGGTGWTAALIAHYIGGGPVTSLEVDPAVWEMACDNLKHAGSGARMLLGDGTLGHPDGSPYDAVHVTVGADRVPHAWVEQTRPGGVIVFPWTPSWQTGAFVTLRVLGDGTAVGRFGPAAFFMPLRSRRCAEPGRVLGDDHDVRPGRVDPRRIVARDGADIVLAAALPGVTCVGDDSAGNGFELDLYTATAAARVAWNSARSDWEVRHCGDRDLYGEAERAFLRWCSWGGPSRERFGYTHTPDGDHIWLDHPTNRV